MHDGTTSATFRDDPRCSMDPVPSRSSGKSSWLGSSATHTDTSTNLRLPTTFTTQSLPKRTSPPEFNTNLKKKKKKTHQSRSQRHLTAFIFTFTIPSFFIIPIFFAVSLSSLKFTIACHFLTLPSASFTSSFFHFPSKVAMSNGLSSFFILNTIQNGQGQIQVGPFILRPVTSSARGEEVGRREKIEFLSLNSGVISCILAQSEWSGDTNVQLHM